MSPNRSLSIVLLIVLPIVGRAQIVLVGLPHPHHQEKSSHANARTKALGLPVWEDFSSTRTTYASPDIWFAGQSIRVNDGMAIHPPSVGVATFDGVDSTGRPYNATDVLAKGYADKLESLEIDLTSIDASERNTVYLSFAYQMQGRGEIPDTGDRLLLSFKDTTLAWVPVATIENDGTLQPDRFYWAVVAISDERFYHPDFKFRIQNFSRLSGPYDSWNVDYIYLNKGRTEDDLDFPDRTISEPLTNLFGSYRIMPIKHFRADTTKTNPAVIATSLRILDRQGDPARQPFSFSSVVDIEYRAINGTINDLSPIQLDNKDSIDADNKTLEKDVYKEVPARHLPNLGPLSVAADSIGLELTFWLNTGDNEVMTDSTGDYDPAKYAPIDFRNNDTTRTSYLLLNKYAYDDGVAEYGAGLNQPGAQVAYEYNLIGVSGEYVTYLEMYFPKFGDESSQVIELCIWNDLAEEPVYTELASLQRTQANEFWVKKLIEPVAVESKFYIGWRQSSAAVIAAGLDKNTDTGDKMYYNTNGEWLPNTLIHGSLMLRPIFGEGLGQEPDGLDEEQTLVVYPNPSSGVFRFDGTADRIVVYDMMGRPVGFHSETTLNETVVTLHNNAQGIYILKAYVQGVVRTAKLILDF